MKKEDGRTGQNRAGNGGDNKASIKRADMETSLISGNRRGKEGRRAHINERKIGPSLNRVKRQTNMSISKQRGRVGRGEASHLPN